MTMIHARSFAYKFWCWTIMGSILWWVLGLNLIIYHFVAFVLFLGTTYMSNRDPKGIFLPNSSAFLLLIAALYFISILIHVLFSESGREVASLYNLSFWIMGFMITIVLANTFSHLEIMPLLKTFSSLAWIIGGLSVLMLLAWYSGMHELVFRTPLYRLGDLFGRTQLVENSLLVRPLLWDWFASASRPRFNIFSPYPTAAAGVIMITIIMITTRAAIEKNTKNIIFLLLFALNGLALFMTLSRISIVAFGISAMIVFLVQRKSFSMWLFIALLFLVLSLPLLTKVISYLLQMREASTSIRMELYMYSLKQLDGIDWILGYGVKPRGEAFGFPIGSHSTVISMLFKSGIIGLSCFIIFQISLMTRWFELKAVAANKNRNIFLLWKGLGWSFIAMGIWMLTEDIDAPQLLSFLYFSLIGVFEGLAKRLRHA